MSKSDVLISDFYQKQKEFGYLESIKLKRVIDENGCTEFYVEIVMYTYPFHNGSNKLLLNFYGAKDIKIGDIEGLFKLLITIDDVSENQWEKVRLRVKEDENEQFSFYCDYFDFKVI